uniref:Mediator of RNA polymerase II transcription subunit 13 n=1 Tax=Hydatigena taeniaeformis TaxID=6205 RepID=A0A0R3WK61_HYDTA
LIHSLSSGAPLRALFQPELHQFQTAFEEAVAEAVDAVGSGVAVVVVVYAGEVLHSTGEWLLADSTFSGEQLHMWLDSNAAAAWQPEIQKLTTAPSGTEPINIVVCTPSAGAKTRWPMPTTSSGSIQFVMLSKSRRLPVRLQTTASWRANGKLPAAPSNATAFEALHALSGELARLHWEHQSKLLAEVDQEFTLAQRSFKDAPPALYLLPSGHGGVQTQACGLFVVQGVNVLLGSAFASNKPPQWWQLVRSLDRLDTAIFPDWSAASIQSYRFLTKHLLHATSASYSANWLGCLFTPAPIEPGVESPLLLTPPTTATANVDPHRLRHLSAQSEHTRLFYKIGVGELSLRYLGSSVGVLLVWHPATGEGKGKSVLPLTIFLPVVHSPETSVLPASLLAGLVRMLRKVPEITVEGSNAITTAAPLKRTTVAPTGAKPPGVAGKTVNSTPPMKAHVNGTLRNTTPASTKPLASKPTPTRTPLSRAPPTKPTAPSKTVPSTTPKSKVTTTTPRSTTSTIRHSTTTTTTTPRDRATHPTTTRPSTASTKTTPLAKKSPAEKRMTPASKTEAKLAEHAAKVAKATAEKPGHEIKYSPAGRPSNLPPRRKVGEKTVMEELNELPEVMKTPATDSLAEVVKPHPDHETEEETSYPDSLHAEEAETKEVSMTPTEAEPEKSAIDVEHHEEISKSPSGMDFAAPAVTENHGAITTPEADDSKTPLGVGLEPAHQQEDLKGSPESPIASVTEKSPAEMHFAMPPTGIEFHKDLETKVSTPETDEHHDELEMADSLAAEAMPKSPMGMEAPMPLAADEHHHEFPAHEVRPESPLHMESTEQSTDTKLVTSPADIEHHQDIEEPKVTELESKSPFHEEVSKSSTGMEFTVPPGEPAIQTDMEDFNRLNTTEYTEGVKESSAHIGEAESTFHEEVSKSEEGMELRMPNDAISVPIDDDECEIPHGVEHKKGLEESKSPVHEDVSKSPAGMT